VRGTFDWWRREKGEGGRVKPASINSEKLFYPFPLNPSPFSKVINIFRK
jgi:hypothetical protein